MTTKQQLKLDEINQELDDAKMRADGANCNSPLWREAERIFQKLIDYKNSLGI